MRVAIVYYSLTGRTREVAREIGNVLEDLKYRIDYFEVRPVNEYPRRLAHINPRVIKDTLSSKVIDIKGIESFNPSNYDLVIICTPIWIGRITPPIRSFIELFKDKLKTPVICITTSNIKRGYSTKFKEYLKSRGIKVVAHASLTNINEAKEVARVLIRKLSDLMK